MLAWEFWQTAVNKPREHKNTLMRKSTLIKWQLHFRLCFQDPQLNWIINKLFFPVVPKITVLQLELWMQGSKMSLVIDKLCVFRPKHISLFFSASSSGITEMALYAAIVYGMEGDVCTSSTESLFAAKIMPQPYLLIRETWRAQTPPCVACICSKNISYQNLCRSDPRKKTDRAAPCVGISPGRLKVIK